MGAEGDGDVGTHVRSVELSGVDVDTGGDVDRDDHRVREPADRVLGLRTQARFATDPDDAVDDDVWPVRRRTSATTRPPCVTSAARPAAWAAIRAAPPRPGHPVGRAAHPAYRASPPLSPEPTSSSTRRAVHPVRAGRRPRSPARRPPAASARPRAACASNAASAARTCSTVCARLMPPIMLSRSTAPSSWASAPPVVQSPDSRSICLTQRSRTTTAVAMPPSWLSERWVVVAAELARRGRRHGAAQLERRLARRQRDHLGVVPLQVPRGAERLGEGLLGGEPGGQRLDAAARPRPG